MSKRQRDDQGPEEEANGKRLQQEEGPQANEETVLQLERIQEQLEKINDEASERVVQIEMEFNKKRRPVYKERSKAISTLPQFWQTALLNHQGIQASCSEDDAQVLAYITEIDVEEFEDIRKGYRIVFKFADDNPFFMNKQLVKSYHYANDGALDIRSDEIQWKAGYEPGNDDDPKEGDRYYRLFTMWFDNERIQPHSEERDAVADVIKEEIWPNPLRYFMGVVDAGMYEEEGLFEEYAGEDEAGYELEEGAPQAGEEEGGEEEGA